VNARDLNSRSLAFIQYSCHSKTMISHSLKVQSESLQ